MGTCLKKGVDAVLAIKEYTVPDFISNLMQSDLNFQYMQWKKAQDPKYIKG